MDVTLTLSSQGQIVIPVKVRRAMQLKPGSKLNLSLRQTKPLPTVILQLQPESWVKYVAGTGKGIWGKGEDYIENERNSWEK